LREICIRLPKSRARGTSGLLNTAEEKSAYASAAYSNCDEWSNIPPFAKATVPRSASRANVLDAIEHVDCRVLLWGDGQSQEFVLVPLKIVVGNAILQFQRLKEKFAFGAGVHQFVTLEKTIVVRRSSKK